VKVHTGLKGVNSRWMTLPLKRHIDASPNCLQTEQVHANPWNKAEPGVVQRIVR